jgi:hypothetical protein
LGDLVNKGRFLGSGCNRNTGWIMLESDVFETSRKRDGDLGERNSR